MFEFLRNSSEERPSDVKGLRAGLLQFIKEELQKTEGGEGKYIKGLHLFIVAPEEEKHLYESAVYTEEEGRFRNEVQKIADDFSLELPDNWTMEVAFTGSFPPEAVKNSVLNTALFVRTRYAPVVKPKTARIAILNGEAEKEEYVITAESGKINIGREKKVMTESGFFRLNSIAFPGDSGNDLNKFISRQHAHIEWNKDGGGFMLFADEGGIPPGNKIKVRSGIDESLTKLNSTQIGHSLQDGDQIVLGDSVVLEFSYLPEQV
jgi:hypothetical protein